MSAQFRRRGAALLIAAALLICLLPGALAAPKGSPIISVQPTDQTVQEGDKCNFTVKQDGATGITWRFYHPETGETVLASQANRRFKGLKVSGQNSEKLRLSNIPGEMDGWQAFCTLANNKGKVETDYATLIVTDKQGNPINGSPAALESPTPTQAPVDTPPQSVGNTPQLIGATAVQDGAICLVTADQANVAYWVINGARYDFDRVPQAITVQGMTENDTLEAVYQGGASQTISSAPAAAGEGLWVRAVNADMCHIKTDGSNPGGYFTQFNFTDSYMNLASGQTEQGGRVSVCVMARLPEGGQVIGWQVGEALLQFDVQVNFFFVHDLAESQTYEPMLSAPAQAQPTDMVRFYPVQCVGCTFTGGGYLNAASGYVPRGTAIILTPTAGGAQWTINGAAQPVSGPLDGTVNGTLNVVCQ